MQLPDLTTPSPETADYLAWINPDNAAINVAFLDSDEFKGRVLGSNDHAIRDITAHHRLPGIRATYCGINPARPECVGITKAAITEIAKINNLAIDLDRPRPSGTPKQAATSDERVKIKAAAERLKGMMADLPTTPLTVDSGNGYYVIYPLDMANTPENHQLIRRLRSVIAGSLESADVEVDATAFEPSHVFGVPGTLNASKPAVPAEGRIHRPRRIIGRIPARQPVSEADFVQWATGFIGQYDNIFADAPKAKRERLSVPEIEAIEDARKLLAALPNDDLDYDKWLRVGMALHHTSDELLDDWIGWSRKSSKHEGEAGDKTCRSSWASMKADKTAMVTLATLAKLVDDGRKDIWPAVLINKADPTPRMELTEYKSPPGSQPAKQRGLRIVSMADIEELPLEWLWPDMIPTGGITIVAGEGEAGKSTMVSSLVARLTTGAKWPDGSGNGSPAKALYVGVEEDVQRMLRPRLRKFSADLTGIRYAYGIEQIKDGKMTLLPWRFKDVADLAETLRADRTIKMVIFDPIGAYMGNSDSWKDEEVQRLLQPLNDLSQELGVTMILIAHLNKGESKSIKHRIMGSVAFVNIARCVIAVIRDKVNKISYAGIVKCNYGGKRKSLPFRIGADYITFDGEVDSDLDSLATAAAGDTGRGAKDQETAEKLIADVLKSGGEIEARILEARLDAMGISRATFYRAAASLESQEKITRNKRGFPPTSYYCWVVGTEF